MRRHALAILLLLAQPAFAGEKDKLYSSTLDVRTVLSFKVADSAAQKMLPEGWQIEAPNTGPSKGSNLSVVLVDQILAQDAEGKPVDAVRGAALVRNCIEPSMRPPLLPRLLVPRLPFFYGWVVLGCICLAGFARQGPAVAVLSLFVVPMTEAFGWSRTEMSGAVSLGVLSSAAYELATGKHVVQIHGNPELEAFLTSTPGLVLLVFAGILGIILTLHIARVIGYIHGRIAEALLVRA